MPQRREMLAGLEGGGEHPLRGEREGDGVGGSWRGDQEGGHLKCKQVK